MSMYQYRDLPQIPSYPDEPQFSTWSQDHMQSYRQHSFRVDEDFGFARVSEHRPGMQTMQRFLQDPSPLTPGVLQAKLDNGMPLQSYFLTRYEQQWSTPNLFRYDSPETSVSGNSSYATQNELRSPHPYHANPYGSTEELPQATFPYRSGDHYNEDSYAPELHLTGGSVSLRQLEYEHQEPEPTVEDGDAVDTKAVAVYGQQQTISVEHSFPKLNGTSAAYKDFSDSGVSNSLRDAESVQPIDPSEGESSDADYIPNKSSKRRRWSGSTSSSSRQSKRRRSHGRKDSATSTTSHSTRVSKRSRRAEASSGDRKASMGAQGDDGQRHFPCPLANYGCQSTFSSKNEWKRHVSTQHIKLGFWRCDLCATTVDPHDDQTIYHNDFNRKDLFAQHLRRMHSAHGTQLARNPRDYPVTDDNIGEHQTRCYQTLRSNPQQSSCLFCEEIFAGPSSWENRIEHIGRHLEKDRKDGGRLLDIASWNVDKVLEQWLLTEGLIAKDRNNEWKIGDGRPLRPSALGDEDSGVDA